MKILSVIAFLGLSGFALAQQPQFPSGTDSAALLQQQSAATALLYSDIGVPKSAEYLFTETTGATAALDSSGNGNNCTYNTNAPTPMGYGLAFLDTGTATTPNQACTTPLQNFGSAMFTYCSPTLVTTTGLTTGGAPWNSYSSFMGPTVAGSGAILLNGLGATPFSGNSVQPSIYNATSGANISYGSASFGLCHTYGYTLGVTGATAPANKDHVYVDGIEIAYTAQGTSSTFPIITSTNVYEIGAAKSTDSFGLRGTLGYAAIWPTGTNLTQSQIVQQTKRANYLVSQRPLWPGLSFDIPSTGNTPVIIFPNDSISAGYQQTSPATAWPLNLVTNKTYSFKENSIGGMLALDVCSSFEQRVVPYSVQGQTTVVLWMDTNDIATASRSAAQSWSAIAQCVAKSKARGMRVFLVPPISRTSSAVDATLKDVMLPYYRNQWRGIGADGMFDIDEVVGFGADGAANGGACYFTDHIHPSSSGACATINGTSYGGYPALVQLFSMWINMEDGSNIANPDSFASNAVVLASSNNNVRITDTAAGTVSLMPCEGRDELHPVTITNTASSTNPITVSAVDSQTISGTTSIAVGATLVYRSIPGTIAAGGCSWQQQ